MEKLCTIRDAGILPQADAGLVEATSGEGNDADLPTPTGAKCSKPPVRTTRMLRPALMSGRSIDRLDDSSGGS